MIDGKPELWRNGIEVLHDFCQTVLVMHILDIAYKETELERQTGLSGFLLAHHNGELGVYIRSAVQITLGITSKQREIDRFALHVSRLSKSLRNSGVAILMVRKS